MLADRFGRTFAALRVSVTDRCDLACSYCRAGIPTVSEPRADILTFEETARLAGVFCAHGVTRIKLTGGEPLQRRGLPDLVRRLRAVPNLTELSLTTNGLGLAAQAAALRDAGLERITVSLDTLRPEAFRALTQVDALPRVLAGIAAARRAGFERIKLNAVVLRGTNDRELTALLGYAEGAGAQLRLIELMPIGMSRERWEAEYVPASEMIRRLAPFLAPGTTDLPEGPGPARLLRLANGRTIGVIAGVSRPFCATCDRLRLTTRGAVRLCLSSPLEFDLLGPLRAGASDQDLSRLLASAALEKPAGATYDRAVSTMCAIGG